MKRILAKFLQSEDGPTSVEYAVMLAMIIGVLFGTIQLAGQKTKKSLDNSANRLEAAFDEAGANNL